MEVERKPLVVLDLHVLAAALQKGLEQNFKNVSSWNVYQFERIFCC